MKHPRMFRSQNLMKAPRTKAEEGNYSNIKTDFITCCVCGKGKGTLVKESDGLYRHVDCRRK